ncbi:uncharacterized protein LOC106170673 [Lingula anatina]|uniref:Uncharacterized protein LOC106170673 n=1 Tax=Lingula anatina TaxID=7574 RepID=A0A1S3J8B5_LINAN|nr:uncharacterized protein LOC106170673 [Lingula anatina]|eukprot:XP_013406099.1 uncharacterized protein LOC106170673 [Lingula anatina]
MKIALVVAASLLVVYLVEATSERSGNEVHSVHKRSSLMKGLARERACGSTTCKVSGCESGGGWWFVSNSAGWNIRGSDRGCCGNYSGCCKHASDACYVHDYTCRCCIPSVYCGPQCQEEPGC